jgi:hypothetical protein
MAINPNTDFTTGAVYTADQANRFPRGIVAEATSNTSSGAIGTSETVTLTSSSFTAVANRYYKITYNEPVVQASGPPGFMTFRIRLTNISGTVLQYVDAEPVVSTGSDGQVVTLLVMTTLTAGSTVIVATARANSSTLTCYGGAPGVVRQLIIEDIGPA